MRKKSKKPKQTCPPQIALLCCVLSVLFFMFTLYFLISSPEDSPDQSFHHPVGVLQNTHQKQIIATEKQIKNHRNKTRISNFSDMPEQGGAKLKRDIVRDIFEHGFLGYSKYCYGKGELRPLSRTCSSNSRDMADTPPMGYHVMANIDSFLLMGFKDFYQDAKTWLETSLKWDSPLRVSVFESTIRCLGVLLLPLSHVTCQGPRIRNNITIRVQQLVKITLDTKKPWGVVTNIAEAGTLSLEFASLSVITNNSIYAQKILENYRSIIQFRPADTWLFPSLIRPVDVRKIVFEGSNAIGGGTDSFYEYLLKYSLLTHKKDKVINEWWAHTVEEIVEKHLKRVTVDGVQMAYINPTDNPCHLECFLGGVFALAAIHEPDPSRKAIQVAEELGQFCRALYTIREGTFKGIPVDSVRVKVANRIATLSVSDASFQQRPEAVETWFYLWRLTKHQKYRDWAWEYIQALETVKIDSGYVSLHSDGTIVDIQHGSFLSETVKYLFLIFSSDTVFPLDRYVFNTEGHPLLRFDPQSKYDLYTVSFSSLK